MSLLPPQQIVLQYSTKTGDRTIAGLSKSGGLVRPLLAVALLVRPLLAVALLVRPLLAGALLVRPLLAVALLVRQLLAVALLSHKCYNGIGVSPPGEAGRNRTSAGRELQT